MKKPKLSLGPGGVKGLLVQHVEKIVFGVAILAVLAFVYLGYKLESKLAGKTPDKLQTVAANAVANIQSPSADPLKTERTPRNGKGGQYFARVQGIDPLDPQNYALKPFKPPTLAPGSKREDPEIFAPIKLETSAVTGALCLKAEEGQKSPLAELDYARAPEQRKEPAKEERKKARGGRRGGGSGGSSPYGSGGSGGSSPYGSGDDYAGMMGGGMGSGGSPYGGDSGDRKKENQPRGPERFYPEDKVCGYRPSGAGMSMARGGSSGGSPYGGTGSPYGGTGSGGGMMPGSGGMMPGTGGIPSTGGPGMPGSGGPAGGPAGPAEDETLVEGEPVAQSGSVIIVKALVPYRKQADEYKRALGEAIGYDPVRDQPWIVFFQAQRVDVTDDPQRAVQEAEWQSILNTNSAAAKIRSLRWHGIMPEVADSAYVDTSATMPAPPMMLRCMDDVMLHSEVPRTKTVLTFEKPEKDEGKEAEETGEEDLDLPGAGLAGGGFAGGSRSPYGGSGMTPGYGGMMPGSGSMMPGSGSMMPGTGSMMPGSGSMMPGSGSMMPGTGSMMPGSGGMMPGYGMGGYMGSMSASAELVQYKLIRFFDTDVQPGRLYRYRVRVFFEDPNNPNSDAQSGFVRFAPPPRRSLSAKVLDRVSKVKAEDEAKNAEKASGRKITTYYVISPWSEATEPVSLPATSRVYAGAVEPARTTLGVDNTPILQTEPYGYIVPVVWDEPHAIDVSTETRSFRGSVLDFSRKQFDVLDPVSLAIKVLKSYDFTSQYMVLDMRGGEDLPGDRKELVTSIGEFAVMDGAGNFRVINELDDYKDYARFTFEGEIVSGAARGGYGSGGGMMPGSGGMMPGAGGMPSTGGPGMPGTGLTLPGTGPAGSSGGGGSKRGRGR